jgi:DNA helicase-2/ATP-dependent DNA helicase PcrA
MKTLLTSGVQPQEIAVLARTNAQLSAVERAMNREGIPYQVRNTERFFDRTDVRDFLKQVRQASVIPAEGSNWIDELRSIAQPFLTGESIDGIAALLHLGRELDENPPTMPVITLATLHAAKGLEWERVYLIGASEGILPLTNTGSTLTDAVIAEERRLFYVGMTRAKADLHITYRAQPSRFLAESTLI